MATANQVKPFNLFKELENTVKGVVKETAKVVKDVTLEAKRVAGNVVRGTKNVAGNISKGVSNVVKNVVKETTKVVKDVTLEAKRVAGNVVRGTKNVAGNISKGVSNVAKNVVKETAKVVKNVTDGVKQMVVGAKKEVGSFLDRGLNIKEKEEITKNKKEREEIEKILKEKEKNQDSKTFEEMVSGIELNDGTISNRSLMADDLVYKNFGKGENAKNEDIIGSVFTVGSGKKAEKFKVLDIKETKSGVRAFVLGNETTKGVEIVFEGSNPGLTNPFANLKNWIKDWSNNLRNLKSKEARNLIRTADQIIRPSGIFPGVAAPATIVTEAVGMLTGKDYPTGVFSSAATVADVMTGEYSKSYEDGTPKSYEDALKITREVQNEYKNGKGGYKGLTMLSGHSKGGAEIIYSSSHTGVPAIAVDPAPVRNPGKYLYDNKILTVVPNYGKGTLNNTKKNKLGVTNISPIAESYGIGSEISKLPAIEVKMFIDEEKNKSDKHKTDNRSVKEVEDKILKQLKSNNIIRGEKNVQVR